MPFLKNNAQNIFWPNSWKIQFYFVTLYAKSGRNDVTKEKLISKTMKKYYTLFSVIFRKQLTLLNLVVLMAMAVDGFSRDTVYVNSFVTINAGTKLFIPGDLISGCQHDAGVRNAGEIHLTGNLINKNAKLFYWSTNGYDDFSDTIQKSADTTVSPLVRRGEVHFIGKDTQYIFNSGNGIFFSDVYISNHVKLAPNSNVHVQGELILKKDLDLNGNTLRLYGYEDNTVTQWGGTGTITGESDTSKIVGAGSIIAIKGNPDAPSSELETLGLNLHLDNSAIITLTRENINQSGVSDGSIHKRFKLSFIEGHTIDSITLHYLNHDLKPTGHSSNNLAIWMYNENATPASKRFASVVDTEKKVVKGIAQSGTSIDAKDVLIFTLANNNCHIDFSLGEDIDTCDGNTVVLRDMNKGNSSDYSYIWNDDPLSYSNTLEVTKSGTYTVRVRNENGCEISDTIKVTFRPIPKPEISVENAPGNWKCVGDSFLFKYKEHNPEVLSVSKIRWDFSDSDSLIGVDSAYYSYTINNDLQANLTPSIKLQVVSNHGCSANTGTQVFVENKPLPCIFEKTISDSVKMFRATNLRSHESPQVSWEWSVSDEISTIESDTLFYKFPGFGTYRIGVKMTLRVCENDTAIWTTISDRADIRFRLSKKDFCVDEPIHVFNETRVYNDDTPIKYALNNHPFYGDAFIFSVQDTGAYIVKMTASTFSGSWYREYTDTIWIHANPVIGFGGEIQTCRTELTLRPQDTGTAYLWYDYSTNSTLLVNQSGEYGLTLTNGYGCMSNESVRILLNTSISSGLPKDTTHCGELALSVNYPNGTYQWSTLENTRSINVATSGTYIVTLTDSICQVIDTISVNILDIPYSNIGRDTAVCSNETIMLSIEPQSDVSYLWNTGHTGTDLTVSAEGTYKLTATHENGCSSRDSITVVVKNAPTLNLGKTRMLCDTFPVDFNLITESGAAAILWTLPDGTQKQGDLLSSSQTGTHTVLVQYSNGCKATDSVDIQRGNTGLIADFLLASAIKLGDSVKLVNTSQPKDLLYQWDISNGFKSSDQSPYCQFLRAGEFNVRLTVSDGSFCPAIKEKIVCVSLDGKKMPRGEFIDPEEEQDSIFDINFTGFQEVKLYPNPNHGDFVVDVRLSVKAGLHALLADQLGRVLDQRIFHNQREYLLEYHFGHLQSGVYLLKLWSGRENREFKIVITK